MPQIDWKKFENTLLSAALQAATRLMERSKGTFYVFVFHEFYAETEGRIALPCLAANTVEALAGQKDSRWSSADWKWSQIKYVTPELRTLHRSMEKAAVKDDGKEWQQIHARFLDATIATAKKLTPLLRKYENVSKDFGVYVFTEDDEVEILQRCMTPAQFKKRFPQLQAEIAASQQLEASPRDAKFEAYRNDLYEHQKELLKLGEEAIPFLCEVLESNLPQNWVAASLLGQLGVPDPRAIALMKQRAQTGREIHQHDTVALALLGEVDFLLKLAETSQTQWIAVQGICSLYSSQIDSARQPRALDYQPVEKLLAIPGCKKHLESLYSGPCEIRESDVDEALRGLKSKHELIRGHAVTVLGQRKLGAKVAARVLPAIAESLQDKSATIRRLAILALSRWKKTAKPYAPEMRKLFRDPDPNIVHYAKQYIKEVE